MITDRLIKLQIAMGLKGDGILGNYTMDKLEKAVSCYVGSTSNTSSSSPNASKVVTDGTWPFCAVVDGDDVVMNNVKATAFGGDNDSMDDGSTASGYNTRGHPGLVACSLPMRHDHLHDNTHGFLLRNSPIPMMPFGLHANGTDNPDGAHVDVTFLETGVTVHNVPVIDLGPAKWTGNALDCSIALARRHNPHATANSFGAHVSVRLHGGAKFIKPLV